MSTRARVAERLLPPLLRAWGATWKMHVAGVQELWEARDRSPDGRVIFCCWHGRMLPLAHFARGRGMRVVVSRHRDGELAARVAARLGFAPLRGSTQRGGELALRHALRAAGGADFGVTVDGPRGPRGRFQTGAVFLASRTGVPIVPVACGASPSWSLRSWDAFLVPRPFASVRVVFGAPILVAPGADGEELERARLAGEIALARVTAAADVAGRPPAGSAPTLAPTGPPA